MNDNIGISGVVKLTFTDTNTGKRRIYRYKNLTCTAGKVSIVTRLGGGTSTGIGIISYCATGTSATAPNAADTQLGAELARKTIATATLSSNTIDFETFFSTSESNGVLAEVGLFGDNATSTPNSGTLYAHRSITKTKTSTDTLTIEWSITIS